MAHAHFHLALGIGLGTALMGPRVAVAWARGQPVGRAIGWMLLLAYGLGAWAIVPNLLTTSGILSGGIHYHPAADAFLLHRAIDLRYERGFLVGELGLGALLVFHYVVLVVAIWRATRQRSTRPPSS